MRPAPDAAIPFKGLMVVEWAQDPAGELAGRLLADYGAEVLKVEPPEGAASRREAPFSPDGGESLHFAFYNASKGSVIVDPAAPDFPARMETLLASADIFISGLQPAALKAVGLDLTELTRRFPRLIIVSVTPYGLTGPWADYRSSDLVALAGGGPLHLCGYDDHALPPIRPGGDQGYHTAASFAHTGALLALLERQRTGLGQIVDVSMHEALAVTIEMAFSYWSYVRAPVLRQTCRHAQPIRSQPALFECGDGRYLYYVLVVAEQKAWKALLSWLSELDMAADLGDPQYDDMVYRQENFPHIQGIVESFFLLQSADEAFRAGQVRGLPVGAVYSPEDLLADPNFKAREFFVQVEGDDGIETPHPGAPYRFSAIAPVRKTRAPRLGERDRI